MRCEAKVPEEAEHGPCREGVSVHSGCLGSPPCPTTLPVRPWESYLTSPSLSLFTCKTGTTITGSRLCAPGTVGVADLQDQVASKSWGQRLVVAGASRPFAGWRESLLQYLSVSPGFLLLLSPWACFLCRDLFYLFSTWLGKAENHQGTLYLHLQ